MTMKKVNERSIKAILAIAVLISTGTLPSTVVWAHPSQTPHHHSESTVEFELDGSPDGSAGHNHLVESDFGGWNQQLIEPYSAFGCWDNRFFRYSTQAQFPNGHCFVDPSLSLNIVRFSFEGPNWNNNLKNVVRLAFSSWENQSTFYTIEEIHGRDGMVVSLEFDEVSANGDIKVYMRDIGDPTVTGTGYFSPFAREIHFNNNDAIDWDTSTTFPNMDDTKYHFLTTALHETGHAIGLVHQDIPGDVMQTAGGSDPEPSSYRNVFFNVDGQSEHGVFELYGQPPSPPSPTVYCSTLFLNCPYGCMSSPYQMFWGGTGAASFEVQRRNYYGVWQAWYSGPNTSSYASTGTLYDELFRVRAINSIGVPSGWCEMPLYVQCSEQMDPW